MLLLLWFSLFSALRAFPSESELAFIPDNEKSFSQWKQLQKEVLVLKCDEYNLVARGTREELALRLFSHHHQHPALTAAYNPTFDETFTFMSPTILPPLI